MVEIPHKVSLGIHGHHEGKGGVAQGYRAIHNTVSEENFIDSL